MTKDDNNEGRPKVVKGPFRELRWANIPRMPRWLSKDPALKTQWRLVMKMLDKTALQPGDAIGLSLLCGVMADHSRVKKEIAERDEIPALVEVLTGYNMQIVVWCREFLITPAARHDLRDKKE